MYYDEKKLTDTSRAAIKQYRDAFSEDEKEQLREFYNNAALSKAVHKALVGHVLYQDPDYTRTAHNWAIQLLAANRNEDDVTRLNQVECRMEAARMIDQGFDRIKSCALVETKKPKKDESVG